MNPARLRDLLQQVGGGSLSVDDALEQLKTLPFEDLGFAKVDHHRGLRLGLPEVIYGEGKSAEQIVAIAGRMEQQGTNVLVTRLDADKAAKLVAAYPDARYEEHARLATWVRHPIAKVGRGRIVVASAGTSDIAVSEEAAITAEMLGNEVERIHDVGVAGIHRLFAHRDLLSQAAVLIVVAGMEGALPSVVGGLVDRPVIAVPTSIGYGASFGGLAALLAMLNSCAPGITVVNIDNGFGAGVAASLINRS
jgi:pyridinium-3,5-biscarboxylic acid mononucleotide synthase